MSSSLGKALASAPRLSLESRPESLTRSVYETIRAAIVDKSLVPGTRVTEADLAEQLNVSKTPVREALLELRQVGLIEEWGRRGGRIVSPSERIITDVAETREATEVFLAGRVAETASDEQRRRILQLAIRSREVAAASDDAAFHECNVQFHLAFAEAIGNRMLRRIEEETLTLSTVLRLRDFPRLSPLTAFAEDHIAIAEAVVDASRPRAEEAARRHVRQSLKYNLSAFRDFSAGRQK